MQEEVTQRTVALCVEATRLSAGMLQQAMKKVLDEMQKGVTGHKTKLHHGKQTLRQLMKHNTGVSNIEITDQNIRAFSATAKKYGIDFALKKDTSGEIHRPSDTHQQVQRMQTGQPRRKRLRKALTQMQELSRGVKAGRKAHRLAELIKEIYEQQIREVENEGFFSRCRS